MPMPWEMDWKQNTSAPSPKKETSILDDAVEAVKAPWEMIWNSLSGKTKEAPKEAQKPWEQSYKDTTPPEEKQFNKVFQSLIKQESRGQHTDEQGNLITSNKGAKGITQVMFKTGFDPGYGVTPLQDQSKEEYIRFGKDYLRAMLSKFDGDYEKALAAYNAGPGNVEKAIAKGGSDWKEHLPKKEETLPYIDKILGKKNAKERTVQVKR